MIGSGKPEKLVEFYKEVFGKDPDMDDGGYSGWQVGNGFVTVYEHSEVKGKSGEGPRIMFNLETPEVKEEFDRIKEIEGTEVVQEPYNPGGEENMMVATFADPDGNYFQLMTPWDENSN